MGTVGIKRIYDAPEESDGYRVLIDRLWPRGESHERADLDEWLKQIAPTTELRTWWNHDSSRIVEFADRYRAELDANELAVRQLRDLIAAHPHITLLYAAHDPHINQAVVLQRYLHEKFDIEMTPSQDG